MGRSRENVVAFASLRKAEEKLRALQTTQSFDGTLRVHLDRVYVNRKDGIRALKSLQELRQLKDA